MVKSRVSITRKCLDYCFNGEQETGRETEQRVDYRNKNQYNSTQIKAKSTLNISSAFMSTFFFLSNTCQRIMIQTMKPMTIGRKIRNI